MDRVWSALSPRSRGGAYSSPRVAPGKKGWVAVNDPIAPRDSLDVGSDSGELPDSDELPGLPLETVKSASDGDGAERGGIE